MNWSLAKDEKKISLATKGVEEDKSQGTGKGQQGEMVKKKDEFFQIINSICGLDDLRVQLERIAKAWGLSKRQLFEINLIIEEICMNYIEHSKSIASSSIGVHLSLGKSIVSITITDKGPAFDPTKVTDSDVRLPMEQRRVGGLGLYLVKQFTDKISYVRVDDTNTLCIEKKI